MPVVLCFAWIALMVLVFGIADDGLLQLKSVTKGSCFTVNASTGPRTDLYSWESHTTFITSVRGAGEVCCNYHRDH